MKHLFILSLLSFTLIACSGKEVDPTEHWSAERLYNEAKLSLDNSEFETAIEYLESLEARYPFGRYATQAQLDVIYAYYQYDEPNSAIASAERFIRLNPKHPNVDYAYYIKGLANFNRGGTILDILHERDLSDFDAKTMEKSYVDLSDLIKRFPNSRYAKDTKLRLVFLRNQMAKSELKIAKYYESQEAWSAVANRIKVLLTKFQGSEVIEEALRMQKNAYLKLGFNDLANDIDRIIKLNYGA